MKDKIKTAWAVILVVIGMLFSRRKTTVEEETWPKEKEEEERVGMLLEKKRKLMTKLSKEINDAEGASQIYTSEKIIKLISGKNGMKELNKKLENLDEKLMEEKKRDIEELKEISGMLKADEEELKEKGIVMNKLYAMENKIIMIQEEMKDLFSFLEEKIKEENKILNDKKTFRRVLENSEVRKRHFKELSWVIAHTRKHLGVLEHEYLRKIWEGYVIKKIDKINKLTMSAKERKEFIVYIRKNFVNPVKERLEGEDPRWLELLEMRMIRHEHIKKSENMESRLEKAVWDLSDEIRKEQKIHNHLKKGFEAINAEMKRLKNAISYEKVGKIAA